MKDRDTQHEEARRNAWETSKSVHERIKHLEKVASDYPEYMTALSDIAVSYLRIDDMGNAITTYQKIIDQKDTFAHIWDDEMGKAYLFTKNYKQAIRTLEKSKVISYDQGIFLAFAYLKHGERQKFTTQLRKWIGEDLEKSFKQYSYNKYIKALFNEEESQYIDESWSTYYEKYANMEPYQLYCELYKQYYVKPGFDEDDIDDEDFEIPPKLSKVSFEALSAEYLSLDRNATFGELDDADYERYFELRDLLFAETILG
jgi:hypothetical protein